MLLLLLLLQLLTAAVTGRRFFSWDSASFEVLPFHHPALVPSVQQISQSGWRQAEVKVKFSGFSRSRRIIGSQGDGANPPRRY